MDDTRKGAGFQRVRRREFEEVTSQIRRQIASGTLREGDRLPAERALAESLGVSRNTVREALRALEYAGLIEQRPGSGGGAFIASGGTHVIRTAFDDLIRLGTVRAPNLTEARIVIGREVAFLACERYDDADLAALIDNVQKTQQAAQAGNLPLRVTHSLEFHRLLGRACKNPVLSIMTDVLTDITMDFVRVLGEMPNDFVVGSRLRMIDLLKRRDCQGAAAEADAYLRTTLRVYLGQAQLVPAAPIEPVPPPKKPVKVAAKAATKKAIPTPRRPRSS